MTFNTVVLWLATAGRTAVGRKIWAVAVPARWVKAYHLTFGSNARRLDQLGSRSGGPRFEVTNVKTEVVDGTLIKPDTSLLPPANDVCEGYVFTRVCLSIRGEYLGRYLPKQVNPSGQLPLQAGTPPGQVPPGQVHPPGQVPPGQVHPPGRYTPLPQCMLGYGQQAGGTHPTGMHSCCTTWKYCFCSRAESLGDTARDLALGRNPWNFFQCKSLVLNCLWRKYLI